MGYTHYWSSSQSDSSSWKAIWPLLVEDTRLIIEASDVLICGESSWDAEDKVIPVPIVDYDKGIYINGVANDGHEPLILDKHDNDGFCKTLQKPYNDVVACVLLRASVLAPDVFRLHSDGDWTDQWWVRARTLYDSLWPGKSPGCPWCRENEYESDEDAAVSESDYNDISRGGARPRAVEVSMEKLSLPSKPFIPNEKGGLISDFDFGPVNRWLSACQENTKHSNCRPSPLHWENLQGVEFRLIDVQKRCVISAPDKCSFVALTYVWGGINQALLTKASIPILMQEGGLDGLWPLIPVTVREAIIACERLGQRYLWVDALCIQQDSSRDLRIQIVRMRQIYSAAAFTIAAVSAKRADEGLLPCYFENSATQPVDKGGPKSVEEIIESSPWSKRAWCYQEKVLSHRMLFFTSSGLYLQCQNATFGLNEQVVTSSSKNDLTKFNSVGGMLFVAEEDELNSYCSAVEHFSSRLLTKRSDKMNAFQGIFRKYRGRMNSKESSFVFGHPIYGFDQTFCWRSTDGLHYPQSRNRDFPSWSWLGWDTAISFDYNLLSAGHTSQIIYQNHDRFGSQFSKRHTAREFRIRKPADHWLPGAPFGFPGSIGGLFYNNKSLSIYVCMAELRISDKPTERKGSNGLYEVFPVFCSQWRRPVRRVPRQSTDYDTNTTSPPTLNINVDEFNATHANPNPQQSRYALEDYNLSAHANHTRLCQAKNLVGKVWLDEAWRADHSNDLIMGCFPIAGYRGKKKTKHSRGDSTILVSSDSGLKHVDKSQGEANGEAGWEDVDSSSSSSQSDNHDENSKKDRYQSQECPADKGWTITSVMLTQRMQKMGLDIERERLQVMECEISQHRWERIGSYILSAGLV